MLRPVLFSAFLAFALQISQAQLIGHGAPASVTSPTADGQLHGVPASVVSPTPRPGVNRPIGGRPVFRSRGPLRRFGNPHVRRPIVVPLPVFYPVYTEGGEPYPSVADPSVPSQDDPGAGTAEDSGRSEDALREAYLQGARDAVARQDRARQEQTRYGEHYLDSREKAHSQPTASAKKQPPRRDDETDSPVSPKEDDKTPAAVFIFKDGHQIETRNFAIMGQMLFDLSSKTVKKIQLADIDSVATLKANDDRGISVKLP
jgi:hypothetical protein